MKTFITLHSAIALSSANTPVSKVVDLLSNMSAKAKSGKKEEEVQYAAYRRWCLDTQQATEQSITDANEKIELLSSAIQKNVATIRNNNLQIEGHNHDINVWKNDIATANKIRDTEHEDFVKLANDYDESIDALGRAIQVLQSQNQDRDQAATLLVQVQKIPGIDIKKLNSFLALGGDNLDVAGYEFQSKGVIEMLKDLHNKFRDEVEKLRHDEAENKNAHSLLLQDRESNVSEATRQVTRKEGIRSTAGEKKGENEQDRTDTTNTRDEDQAFLAETTSVCNQKASDFESRSQLRTEEIAALDKAIEILSSEDVKGAAERHLPSLTQTSLLQMASSTKKFLGSEPNNEERQNRVASYLKIRGAKLNSRVLQALAVRVEGDPFAKVKKMIEDLVVRLLEQANNEATKKGWCDKELASNEHTRKEKTSTVEKLHSEKDLLNATISELKEDVMQLTAEVAQLDKDVMEATENRQKEKTENEATIKDAQGAQVAVARALQVLQDFYAKAGDATALVQEHGKGREGRPAAPPVFQRPFKGAQAESGGVLGILEVIQSDFTRLEAETKASENQSAKEFDEFTQNARVNKAVKKKDIEHKMVRQQDSEQELQETTSDLEGTQEELGAALNEYSKLEQSCLDTGLSYEERVQAREEEVQSLKEALKLLENPDAGEEGEI